MQARCKYHEYIFAIFLLSTYACGEERGPNAADAGELTDGGEALHLPEPGQVCLTSFIVTSEVCGAATDIRRTIEDGRQSIHFRFEISEATGLGGNGQVILSVPDGLPPDSPLAEHHFQGGIGHGSNIHCEAARGVVRDFRCGGWTSFNDGPSYLALELGTLVESSASRVAGVITFQLSETDPYESCIYDRDAPRCGTCRGESLVGRKCPAGAVTIRFNLLP